VKYIIKPYIGFDNLDVFRRLSGLEPATQPAIWNGFLWKRVVGWH